MFITGQLIKRYGCDMFPNGLGIVIKHCEKTFHVSWFCKADFIKIQNYEQRGYWGSCHFKVISQ